MTQLRGWLVSIEITHDVTMGIIDVYYKLIYNVLKDYFLKIWIVNTYCIKNVSCHKTEKKQKELICQLRTYLTVSVLSLCH